MAEQEQKPIDGVRGEPEDRPDEIRNSTIVIIAGNIVGFGFVAYAVTLLNSAKEGADLAVVDGLFAVQIALVGLAVLVGMTALGLVLRVDRD